MADPGASGSSGVNIQALNNALNVFSSVVAAGSNHSDRTGHLKEQPVMASKPTVAHPRLCLRRLHLM